MEAGRKKISMVIPTYNEKDNIFDDYNRLKGIMDRDLKDYDYEMLFIDNFSNDGTREELRILAEKDKNDKHGKCKDNGYFYGGYHSLNGSVRPSCADVLPREGGNGGV